MSIETKDWRTGTLWKHEKSAQIYLTIGGCRLEATGEPAVLYRIADNERSTVWARASDEFLDGRFTRVEQKS